MDPSLAVELLREYPQLLAVVAIVARVARAWQASLTWPEYRALHRFKRGVFPLVDRLAGVTLPLVRVTLPGPILLVSDKGGRDDAEYDRTAKGTLREVAGDLRAAGASLHLLNSLKRRPADFAEDATGDTLSGAHLVWTIDDDQVEAYLFRNDGGTVDIYVHTEASVDNPLAHLTGEQIDGDAYGVVPGGDEKETERSTRRSALRAKPCGSRSQRLPGCCRGCRLLSPQPIRNQHRPL